MPRYPGKDAGNSSFCLQAPERRGMGMILTNTMCWWCQHSGVPMLHRSGGSEQRFVLRGYFTEVPQAFKRTHPVLWRSQVLMAVCCSCLLCDASVVWHSYVALWTELNTLWIEWSGIVEKMLVIHLSACRRRNDMGWVMSWRTPCADWVNTLVLLHNQPWCLKGRARAP